MPLIATSELLATSIDAATRAGSIIRTIRDRPVEERNISTKTSAQDFLTEADLQSQNLIFSILRAHFPEATLRGEESVTGGPTAPPAPGPLPLELGTLPTEELTFWVDPVDGTHDFVIGALDCVTVLIGIARNGSPVAGVIHFPFTGQTVFGVVGYGAFGINFHKCHVPSIIFTHHHPRGITPDFERLQPILQLFQRPLLVRYGGMGAKAIHALEIGALYVDFGTGSSKWDSCAATAIYLACGGIVVDVYGNPLDYDPGVPLKNTSGVIFVPPDVSIPDFAATAALMEARPSTHK